MATLVVAVVVHRRLVPLVLLARQTRVGMAATGSPLLYLELQLLALVAVVEVQRDLVEPVEPVAEATVVRVVPCHHRLPLREPQTPVAVVEAVETTEPGPLEVLEWSISDYRRPQLSPKAHPTR